MRITDYIALMAECQRANARGQPFTPPAVLLQQHGRSWREFSPRAVRKGAQKQCFRNTLHLCLADPTLTYVEGYAIGLIPLHHAWAADPEGRIIETTWRDAGTDYFGIPFTTEYASRAALEVGHYGLLDGCPRVMHDDPATFVRTSV